MAKLQSPSELIDYAKRKLGEPMITIQIDPTQSSDRVDDVLQLFMERHYDGVEEKYLIITSTALDETNGFFTLPDEFVTVSDIYESAAGSVNTMTDVRWQIMMEEVWKMGGVTLANYEMTMQNLELLSEYFHRTRFFKFNKATNRLTPQGVLIKDGNTFAIKGYTMVTPDSATSYALDVYNDEWVKKMMVAQMKMQWGTNIKPFDGVPLPGGITVNGQQLFDEANEDINRLLEEYSNTYELPVDFAVG